MWIGALEGVPGFQSVSEYLNQELKKRGFAEETKGYVPHITLARMKTREGEEIVAKTLPTIQNDPLLTADCGAFLAQECLLIQSELRPEGPIYTPLKTFAFSAGTEYNR